MPKGRNREATGRPPTASRFRPFAFSRSAFTLAKNRQPSPSGRIGNTRRRGGPSCLPVGALTGRSSAGRGWRGGFRGVKVRSCLPVGGGRAGAGAGGGKKCLARLEDGNRRGTHSHERGTLSPARGNLPFARRTLPNCTGTLSFSRGTLSSARRNLPLACCNLPHVCFNRAPVTRIPLVRPRPTFCRAYAGFIAICSSSVFSAPRGVARTASRE